MIDKHIMLDLPESLKADILEIFKTNHNRYYDTGLDIGISEPTVKKIINEKNPKLSIFTLEKIKNNLREVTND